MENSRIQNIDSEDERILSESIKQEQEEERGNNMENNNNQENNNTINLGGIMKSVGLGMVGGAAAYFVIKKLSGGDEKTANEIAENIDKLFK